MRNIFIIIIIWFFTLLIGFFTGFIYSSKGRFFRGKRKSIILFIALGIIIGLSVLLLLTSNWSQALLVLTLSIFIANPLGQSFFSLLNSKSFNEDIKRRYGVTSSDKAIIEALQKPLVDEIAQEYALNAADFRDLLDAVKRMGFINKDAEKAIKDKRVVAWYFNNVGTGGQFDIDKSMEFTLLIKNCIGING